MPRLSFKIAFPIIVAGLFVTVSFIAINYNNLTFGFYIILVFLAIYLFLFGFAIGQNFTAPVKKLLKKANDLNKGDLKSRFYSESKDEIGELSNVFNKIADKLEESSYENEKTKRSVDIKVEAQTQGLKETINNLEQKVQNRTLEIQKMLGDLEKFKEYSKQREVEASELKEQVLELKDKLEKHGGKKNQVEQEEHGQLPPMTNGGKPLAEGEVLRVDSKSQFLSKEAEVSKLKKRGNALVKKTKKSGGKKNKRATK